MARRTHNSSGGVGGDGELLVALVVSVQKICQRKQHNTKRFKEKLTKTKDLTPFYKRKKMEWRNEDGEMNNL